MMKHGHEGIFPGTGSLFVKRLLSFLLLAVLTAGLLTGCGPADVPSGGNTDGTADASSDPGSDASGEEETRSAQEILEASEHLVGICDQKNSRIIVCDLAEEDWSDDNAVVWEYRDPSCRSVAGIKLRYSEYWDELVVVYCWHGGAAIVSYETKKELYRTTNTGNNPHSVELLPEGHLIVASSTDNDVRVFSADAVAAGQNTYCDQVQFPNAHGVLWDPEYDVLWLLGTNQLSAYNVLETDGKPAISAVGGMTYYTKKAGGHDLAPVYGNKDALFVTCSAGILMFDKVKETFTSAYPGGSIGARHTYAPGTGNFAGDNVFFFTSISDSTKVLNDWCTNIVFVYVPKAEGVGKLLRRKAPDDAYYKVRTWCPDYQ